MSDKKFNERPELSLFYSAIDGIIESKNETEAIRSDVLEILSMERGDFEDWYWKKKIATRKLLEDYKEFASIPHLYYGSEKQKYGMDAITHVSGHIGAFEKALDYLEKIRERYYEKD